MTKIKAAAGLLQPFKKLNKKIKKRLKKVLTIKNTGDIIPFADALRSVVLKERNTAQNLDN